MRTFEQLCAEADALVSARAGQAKTAADSSAPSTEIEKLAAELLAPRAQPAAAVKVAEEDAPLGAETICKLAHARALMDTFVNLPALTKMAAFEEKARAAGHSEADIAGFFRKNAAAFKFRSIFEVADWVREG